MPLKKITAEEIGALGVVAAPDVLAGTPTENKAIFDRLVRELVAVVVNRVIDEANRLAEAEPPRAEAEAARAAAEVLRVLAEGGRVDAEGLRVLAETGRIDAEGLRILAESGRADAEGLRALAELGRVSSTEGVVARAGAEADRACGEGDRAGREADRAEGSADDARSEADRSGAEASRAKAEADRAQYIVGDNYPTMAEALGYVKNHDGSELAHEDIREEVAKNAYEAVQKSDKATEEEALSGVDNCKWMTPKTTLDEIKSPIAHATMFEAAAGADRTKIMDPATTQHAILLTTLGPNYIAVRKRYEYPKGTPLANFPVQIQSDTVKYLNTDKDGYIQITGDGAISRVIIYANPIFGFQTTRTDTVTARGLTILDTEVLVRDYVAVPGGPSAADKDFLFSPGGWKIYPSYAAFPYLFDIFALGGGGAGTYSTTNNGVSGATNGAVGGGGGRTTTLKRVQFDKWYITSMQIGSGGIAFKTVNNPGQSGGQSFLKVYTVEPDGSLKELPSKSCLAAGGDGASRGGRQTGANGGSGSGAVDYNQIGLSGSNGGNGGSVSGLLGGIGQGSTTRKWGEGLGDPYGSAGGGSVVQSYAEAPTLKTYPGSYGSGSGIAKQLTPADNGQQICDTAASVAKDNTGGGGGGISLIRREFAPEPIITHAPSGGSGLVSVRWRP